MFGKRLSGLRKSTQVTQQELASFMNVTQATISNWEKGKKNPNIQDLIDLSNFFNVSSDYLLGLSDQPK